MATIAENLRKLITAKNNIIDALKDKGIEMPDNANLSSVSSLITSSSIAPQTVATDISKCGRLLTKFAVFSDIHLNSPNNTPDYQNNYGYRYGATAFDMLSAIKDDLDFVAFNGDCLLESGNTSSDVFRALKPIFDGYRTKLGAVPLYMICGNHDMSPSVDDWKYVSQCASWNVTQYNADRTCYYKEINGDLFVWFSVWNLPSFNYTSEMYAWLFNLLDANVGRKRIFLFTHWFDGSVDEFGWRALAGQHYNNGWAATDASHATRGPFGQIKNYKNVIWFSGHSHTNWEYEDTYPTIKVHSNNTAKMVSIPSIYTDGQLAVVEVYSNMVVVKPYTDNAVLATDRIYYIGNGVNNGSPTATYSVINALTGVNNSNNNSEVAANASYASSLTLASGYENMQVTVTMGGTNVTSTVYNSTTGVIAIPSVTGNLVITATASQTAPTYSITYNLTNVTSSNSATSVQQNGAFSTTLTCDSGYTNMHIRITQGGSLLHEGDSGATEPITLQRVTGNLVITAVAPIPRDITAEWDVADSTHPTYVKMIYDVADTSVATPLLADGSQSGQTAFNISYVSDMIIDGVQVTPALAHQFSEMGKHEVLVLFADNQIRASVCYKVQDLWSVMIPSNYISTNASCFKSCPKLTKAYFKQTLSNAVANNFVDKGTKLEVVKFGAGVPGLNGANILANIPALTDIYIEGSAFSMTDTNIGGEAVKSGGYVVHVSSSFDQSAIAGKFPDGTITADL